MKLKLQNAYVYIILFVVYIFPVWLVGEQIVKFIFLFINIIYLFYMKKEITKNNILFMLCIGLLCIMRRDIDLIQFFALVGIDIFVKNKKIITINKFFLFLIIAISSLYSIFRLFGENRFLLNVSDPNVAGFMILILGLICRKYYKYLSYAIISVGLLTFSRNFLISLLLIFLFKKIITKYNYSFLNFFNLFKILILSSIILIFFAFFYIHQYYLGNISDYQEGIFRFFTFLDYSNFFRFSTNLMFILLLFHNINYFIFGLSDTTLYFNEMLSIARNLSIPHRATVPHNFLFSYLRLYGIAGLYLIWYISDIVKKITNINNLHIFFGLIIYPIFLSIGFNNYYLFLTVLVMKLYKGEV